MDWLPPTVLIALPHAIYALFIFAIGACVGSFINVVAIRLPMGMGLVQPPSRCPTCGRRLRWHENIPIVGWIAVRGKCRSCGVRVSAGYPAVEALVGALCAGLYLILFAVDPAGRWGGTWPAWFQSTGFMASLPAFAALCALVAALVAATLTDLRTYLIPIQVTAWPTAIGLCAWAIQASLGPSSEPARAAWRARWPVPLPDWTWIGVAIGAAAGLLVSNILLRAGKILPSFHDYHEYQTGDSPFADYPHARREILRELRFVVPAVAGAAAGAVAGMLIAGAGETVQSQPPPLPLAAAGASVLGYLAGAGIVWIVRVLGTLAKGVEAMGMGDVHLMGAAGAVLGWIDPVVAFLVAPFIGLSWIAGVAIAGRMRGGSRREIPYGPHLAVAVLALVLLRPVAVDAGRLLFPAWMEGSEQPSGKPSAKYLGNPPRSP
jgi:leader peptidase (prepilin peptidase)/N-methyltransferase